MKDENREELESRRQFFKKAAKAALPILGAALLSNVPLITKAAESGGEYCEYGCSYSCSGSCAGRCTGTCSGGCKGGCGGACSYSCQNTCKGRCQGSCSGGCSSMNSF